MTRELYKRVVLSGCLMALAILLPQGAWAGDAAVKAAVPSPTAAKPAAAAAAPDPAKAELPDPAAKAPAAAGVPAAPAVEAKPTGPAAIVAEADRLWKVREPGFKGKNNLAATTLLQDGVKQFPKNYDLLWRQARAIWWRADGAADVKVKSAWGKRAMDIGDRARALEPDKVEGHYYAAIGVGAWAVGMGVFRALTKGIGGKFMRRLDRAIEIKADRDCGGPMLSKGRYFFKLPWPKYDGDDSLEWLGKVLKVCPKNPRAHLFIAQTLWKEDQEDKARAHLKKALAIAPGDYWDPPEVRRVHAWAKTQAEAWKK